MEDFEYDAQPGRVVFGPGARHRVAAEVRRLGASRVLLVASGSARAAADEIAVDLGASAVARWGEVVEHVPVELATRARAAARAQTVDCVVCVGGGSAIGLAKAIVLEIDVPVVAVPTTYAGSEMTPIWGMTGEHKQTGRDPRVLPRAVVYDPELTLRLPPDTTVQSALNALAHCVEGLYGSGRNPVTSLLALEGIRVLAAAVPRVRVGPGDLAVRSDLLYGAYLAGSVIAHVGVGIHHRTCHVLGGSYGVAHAAGNAVVLPHALAYNAPAVPDAYARIAAAMGSRDPAGGIHDLVAAAGLPTSLSALGVPEDVLDAAARRVVAETGENPRTPDVPSVRAMLDDAWRGTRPSVAAG